MYIQYGVRLVGITYVVLGVLGFLPVDAINPLHTEGIGVRYLLNLVAINWAHNLIHLAIGVSGIVAAGTLRGCRIWAWTTGTVLLGVFAAGMDQAAFLHFPVDQCLLGIVPLNSPGHMLHAATGGIALYLAMARPTP